MIGPGAAPARACFGCGRATLAPLLDFGPQPLSNRFLRDPSEKEAVYDLALAQCAACALIQVVEPVPAAELAPRVDWITYGEPEDHLDDLVRVVCGLPDVRSSATVAGVSFKDDSTLARFRAKGFERTWRIDPMVDLGIEARGAGVETIQDRLTPLTARVLAGRRGTADVLVVRHILEHAHEPQAFMAAIASLVSPEGYVVVEVPDCQRALESHDYTTVWEEHTLYFTRETFRQYLTGAGFRIAHLACYPYPFENSLVAIARRGGDAGMLPDPALVEIDHRRGDVFARAFPERRDATCDLLDAWRRDRGTIALFGAGHLASTWVNLFGVRKFVDFTVDDNVHKRGLYMPGSCLPIRGSGALMDPGVTVCLLSVNPLGEDRVVERNAAFVERGGAFFSIFPTSPRALLQ